MGLGDSCHSLALLNLLTWKLSCYQNIFYWLIVCDVIIRVSFTVSFPYLYILEDLRHVARDEFGLKRRKASPFANPAIDCKCNCCQVNRFLGKAEVRFFPNLFSCLLTTNLSRRNNRSRTGPQILFNSWRNGNRQWILITFHVYLRSLAATRDVH